MIFHYEGHTSLGQIVIGQVEAENESEAAGLIRKKGHYARELKTAPVEAKYEAPAVCGISKVQDAVTEDTPTWEGPPMGGGPVSADSCTSPVEGETTTVPDVTIVAKPVTVRTSLLNREPVVVTSSRKLPPGVIALNQTVQQVDRYGIKDKDGIEPPTKILSVGKRGRVADVSHTKDDNNLKENIEKGAEGLRQILRWSEEARKGEKSDDMPVMGKKAWEMLEASFKDIAVGVFKEAVIRSIFRE